MSEDWSAVAIEVARGLLEAGTLAYIVRDGTKSGPGYNPTFGSPSELECTVVFVGWANGEIDGTQILATDKKVLVAADGVVPSVADRFAETKGGETAEIVNVTAIAPAGTAVLYELQTRK